MKKMKNDNKGFTLVELIVVLVILAILAAILVPALLGYIDEAKNKQLELHGKSVYTAAQAVASKMYAKNAVPSDDTNKTMDTSKTNKAYFKAEVVKISELSTFAATASDVKAVITFGSTTDKDKYTVQAVAYTEDGGTTWTKWEKGLWTLQTGSWADTDTGSSILVQGS
ncbi:MAG: prepilin-type N-terminal cleavage/methylation domain-containing protein [Lachnospiraceae bacterium]|nr:prepilin-type N-terminal cleavage/methylation domain-containing protein [Lachnospiraceae bacterium]